MYKVCAIPWGVCSTIGVCNTVGAFSTVGDIIMHVGDILSTVGDVPYCGGYHDKRRDIFSTMGCSVLWGIS